MKNFRIVFASISILILIFAGCNVKKESAGQTSLSGSEIDNMYQDAAKYYRLLCSGCHGNKVMAFVDREWENGHTPEFLAARISDGDENDGMPSFKGNLTEEEITNLAEYINLNIENLAVYDFDERPDVTQVFESEKLNYNLELVTDGLEIPWSMAFLPGERMLITDRNGKMYLRSGNGTMTEMEGIPEVLYKGQGGLMDVELHPDFAVNQMVYISYSIFKEEGDLTLSSTAIARARLDENRLEELEVIFEAQPYLPTRHHYGCRMEFDPEGYLYFSVGDRGRRDDNPQSLENHCGKIHRLNDDGTIPEDNPFVNTEGAMPSIYSYGHRNPQGVTLNPKTGMIWAHEHGPRGGDEINLIRPGLNFGWPVISYGINYDGTIFTTLTEEEGMEQPLHYWVPSIAACGMDFITGDRYPGWEGNLLVGSLKYEYLNMCVIDGDKVVSEEMLLKNIGRVRDVIVSPDGYIYVSVEDPGVIYKLIPV
jgi:glucose/arabinose dehydrogenase